MNVSAIREFQFFHAGDRCRCAGVITERDSCNAVVSIDLGVGEGVIEHNLVMTTAATDGVSALEPAIFANLERVVTCPANEQLVVTGAGDEQIVTAAAIKRIHVAAATNQRVAAAAT